MNRREDFIECLNCSTKCVGCHSTCLYYIVSKRKVDKRNEEIKKKKKNYYIDRNEWNSHLPK